ncbi:hypothetical protein ACFLZ2_05475 [Candidatus Margulisiibacteriota bacterium]
MGKVILCLIVLSLIFLVGCAGVSETYTLNKPYDEVFSKTIRFAYDRGWRVAYQDKEAGIIEIALEKIAYTDTTKKIYDEDSILAGSTSTTKTSTNRLTLMFTPKGNITEVKAKANNPMWWRWTPEETIKEYKAYIEK